MWPTTTEWGEQNDLDIYRASSHTEKALFSVQRCYTAIEPLRYFNRCAIDVANCHQMLKRSFELKLGNRAKQTTIHMLSVCTVYISLSALAEL